MEENKLTNEELKYCYKYPHPSVTTDCVIFGFDGTKLSVLLVMPKKSLNMLKVLILLLL